MKIDTVMTMPSRQLCPQCKRARWIPAYTAPWCTPSCKRAAQPTAPAVTCCACSARWDARDKRVLFRPLDGRWQCVELWECRERERRRADVAAMRRALDQVWGVLEANGWRI